MKLRELLWVISIGMLVVLVIFGSASNVTPCVFASVRLHSFSGPDMSTDGLTLTDLFVEGPSELGQGDRLTFFFVLGNNPDNPRIELSNKGLFVAAIDPEGNNRSFGFMYPLEIIEPGQDLIFYGEFSPTVAGTWRFWPSYEIKVGEEETKIGPQDWHSFTPIVETRRMPDLTPISMTLTPSVPSLGDEVRITLMTENIGNVASSECYGALFIQDTIWTSFNVPSLEPGEIFESIIGWFPSDLGLWHISAHVDYWEAVLEFNENNNFIDETAEVIQAERPILEFAAGPRVTNISQTSATISWETTIQSVDILFYGSIAGSYLNEEQTGNYSRDHIVRLNDLRPSTTYHFSVVSQGFQGDTIESRDMTFVTSSNVDNIRPSISFSSPDLIRGIIEIQANVSDNVGVEKTEYYIDNQLAFTDFSAPYAFSIDTFALENGVHTLSIVATDFSGQSVTETRPIQVFNIKDEYAPEVEIIEPEDNAVLTGKVQVTATLSDDVGLAYVFFKVDGQSQGFKGLPSNPTDKSVSFTWDTTKFENGQYRIGVEAFDVELRDGFDVVDVTIDNPPVQLPPQLKLVGHSVTRQDNHFFISLTVKNVGDIAATDVVIYDFLRSFQPISGSDNVADYKAYYDVSENMGKIRIESKVDISPTWSYTYTYEAVPILFHGLLFLSDLSDSPAPGVGNSIEIMYEDTYGSNYREKFNIPVLKTTNGESISESYDNAVKSADYLLLTDAHRLFDLYIDQEVNNLLSTMGKIAKYEEGVLGYSSGDYGHNQVIRDLIKHGGAWNIKLKSGWSSNGYLLLVGETEVVPSWIKNLGTHETTKGDYTWKVMTDLPYANTIGDESKPELSVGRIIGNNARELNKVLENSLNVLLKTPGYEFDRSNALFVSGFPDSKMGNFDGQVNDVSYVLSIRSPSTALSKVNTPDYVQYDSSGKIDDNVTKAAIEYIFFSSTKGNDIIYLAGHGNWDHWDKIDNSAVLGQNDPFGWVNPFVFASSCLTGYYSSGYSVAESFLQRGAVVYLGATESGGWTHYSKRFFEMWDNDEPISLAVKEVKRSLGNDLKDRIWTSAYHVYGDAKFGSTSSMYQTILYKTSSQSDAPASIEVGIPEYEVDSINGEDYVVIPGGSDYFEIGMPLVPCYEVSMSYPNGYRIQDVDLVHKSDPIDVSGLNLPDSILRLPGNELMVLSTQSGENELWPDRDYDWNIIHNPENSSLVITIYPFIYNLQTGEGEYYENYEFFINYTISNVEITGVSTDKHDYVLGEPVRIDLEINSMSNDGRDVVVNTIIKNEDAGIVVDGFDLRTLKGLIGNASYSAIWDSSKVTPGNYLVEIELMDSKGVLLDQKVENIRLGKGSCEILDFDVNAESNQSVDRIQTRMKFINSGDVDISGTAIISIQNSTGVIQTSEHVFSGLIPSQKIEFKDEWDTRTENDTVKIVGYVIYEGYSTPLVIENISLTPSTTTSPELPSMPEPEKPRGIPGFQIESLIFGTILAILIFYATPWLRDTHAL